jgi:hypothetical protein
LNSFIDFIKVDIYIYINIGLEQQDEVSEIGEEEIEEIMLRDSMRRVGRKVFNPMK